MKTILLIEDHPDILNVMTEVLELSNYKVLSANNGRDGVRLALEQQPDLIICDIMMPVMDGYAVIHTLQKHHETEGIPFIFLTAMADRADIRKGMDMGADDYITKPLISPDELLTAVESRLKRSERIKMIGTGLDGLNALVVSSGGKDLMEVFTEDRNTQRYKKRGAVYTEGNRPQFLFFVKRGKVKTYKANEDGKELVTSIYVEGEFLGYNAIIEEGQYQESAEAMEETEVLLIPSDDFKVLMNSSMEALKKFAKLLANNITERENKLLNIAYNSLRKKVATALTALLSKYKKDNTTDGVINIGRENLANFAGTAKESVIRTLSDFKEEKLIDIVEGDIVILNEEKLRKMVN